MLLVQFHLHKYDFGSSTLKPRVCMLNCICEMVDQRKCISCFFVWTISKESNSCKLPERHKLELNLNKSLSSFEWSRGAVKTTGLQQHKYRSGTPKWLTFVTVINEKLLLITHRKSIKTLYSVAKHNVLNWPKSNLNDFLVCASLIEVNWDL